MDLEDGDQRTDAGNKKQSPAAAIAKEIGPVAGEQMGSCESKAATNRVVAAFVASNSF
jgi:hypothetical protein